MADNLPSCDGEPIELDALGLRVASIFIILAAALAGALAPIFLARQTHVRVPKLTFFVFKYVGTGVILATAWMHLLAPAIEHLGNHCVTERWMGDYPWALCIGLLTVLVMFFVELMASRAAPDAQDDARQLTPDSDSDPAHDVIALQKTDKDCAHASDVEAATRDASMLGPPGDVACLPCAEDLARARNHDDDDDAGAAALAAQLTAIFILEFGVVFHSVFIGLTLGTTPVDGLVILLVVLVFHQMFEGLGLGSRLALAPWPRARAWLPYALALGFAVSTPVGIAAGLAARPSNAATQMLISGIFDSISAGILMYTGLVELLAHEFMFNPEMRRAPLQLQLLAFGCIAAGVSVMALLANWA